MVSHAEIAIAVDRVHELIRTHQSTGRALLYALQGRLDVEVSASGSWVRGAFGDEYLDFGSYGVFLLGHGHQEVVRAVAKQLGTLSGTTRVFPVAENAEAAAALAALAPPGLTKVMFLNSGAEAVEAALKLARAKTGRSSVWHLERSFHGKTIGALSLTDSTILRSRSGPLLADTRAMSRSDAAEAADLVIRGRPAAVFVEPVQGEGGIYEVLPGYLKAMREACSRSGSLLVCDEIQCGLGRTGTVWATDATGVVPDILLAGKALGGGLLPVSAIIARPEAFEPFDRDPLLHTSTFGGNPLASAAVVAATHVVRSEDVGGRAARLGVDVSEVLQCLVSEYPHLFRAVSGRGLMLGLHCIRPEIAGMMIRSCLAQRILVTPCLISPNVIRITPSAFIAGDEMKFAKTALLAAAADTSQQLSEEP